MSVIEKKLHAVAKSAESHQIIKRPSDVIAERRSNELIIAFAGPIGSGVKAVKERVENSLRNSGYDVKHVKISDYIRECITSKLLSTVSSKLCDPGAGRYIQLQNAGNELRSIQSDFLAEYSIGRIAELRTEQINEEISSTTDYVPQRTAYLIDQLKHHDEVALFRALYGNLFYLFGVFSTSPRRENRLRADGIEPNQISDLIERDRRQKDKNGQQLDKALQLADFFIRNDHANADALKDQVSRFIELIHGANGITPTKEEYGMYAAYSSGLRSACLSRQVGASIMNDDGAIIATGRNDVPKPGGGLYGPECGKSDARCVKQEEAQCHNDLRKEMLVDEIERVIHDELNRTIKGLIESDNGIVLDEKKYKGLELINVATLAKRISIAAHDGTRLGGLIEFSRSIHAEMDAIVSLAMKGGGSTKNATLFTYTFPCHNCARHVVAAGIKTVYFLEPYEKSLALQLHSDAIAIEGAKDDIKDDSNGPVRFLHFEGVAPRQYLNMFTPSGERKDSKTGKAVKVNFRDADKKIPEYLDDYRVYELKVVEHLTNVINGLKPTPLPDHS
jgi:deoxycytidylate deaminase